MELIGGGGFVGEICAVSLTLYWGAVRWAKMAKQKAGHWFTEFSGAVGAADLESAESKLKTTSTMG